MKAKEPWDTEWAAELAAEALRWLARNYPECVASASLSDVLKQHEDAAYRAAMDADEEGYREALRAYCRAGRDEALWIRSEAGAA
jgi:hypothetical protein